MKTSFSFSSLMRFALKALLIMLVCGIVIGIVALKLIERSPDQLKIGFESYLTQIAGYPAEIGKLNKVQFFPSLLLDMENIRFWPLDDPNGKAITIDHISTNMPLWSVMVGQPRFSLLSLDNMVMAKEVTGIAPLSVKRLSINETGDGLALSGMVGALAIEASVPLERISDKMYRMPRPPLRITGKIEGGRTSGDYFIDVNKNGYGATVTFESYRAADMYPVQQLLQRWLVGHADGALPVQLHIERLGDKAGGQSGPYVVPALRLENGHLQPLECFYNNQGRATADIHPCAPYFDEPTTDLAP